MSGLKIVNPGILALIQDRGRFGYQHLGLSTGGAADEHAYLWANRLLGNPLDAAAIEICFGGLELEAQLATRVALTGADLHPTLNGDAVDNWQTLNLKPGDRLSFGHAKQGMRAYLTVQGGFAIEPTFGSVATVMREQIGGLDGRGSQLQAGDLLPCQAQPPGRHFSVPNRFRPDYSQPLTLRVIEGQQSALFPAEVLTRFYREAYVISPQSDRMGVRLSGPALAPLADGIISEGVSFGAIQVPKDGQPIILLKDRQTIGGYPKLGTVFALDAFALAQRQPHVEVCFAPMPLHDAQRQLQQFYRFFTG
ncbi:5-oxoprolinase subunit C family protein [Marinobacterium weihaiense]|uniref:Biotin-dependent carboxyltransferase family protein n=1 Tax=Marinobacterium weihaiense TaxID=2851016 RepID=A0ABS6MDR4_9GAMM|nr:biotin-dependent carboxyltransferase family protein [Marinobacterium weihaiense]MBV0934456.1 biotin-dependent carboxyltransferase family protein [Marinobacterium weihaiense]